MTNGALLHDLVLAQAGRTPDATAVSQGDHGLTYRELVSASAALAQRLRDLGAGPEVRIGICHRRTPDLLVCVLGVLMSGGAYVPLDPSHPRRRLEAIIEDAGITTCVADETGIGLLAGLPVRLETARRPNNGKPPAPIPPTGQATPVTSTGRPMPATLTGQNVQVTPSGLAHAHVDVATKPPTHVTGAGAAEPTVRAIPPGTVDPRVTPPDSTVDPTARATPPGTADPTARVTPLGMVESPLRPTPSNAAAPPPGVTLPDAAAYVLFTSGSTGRPKGVVVSHAAAVSFVTMAGEVFGLDAGCRSIGFAALGFDVSVLDVFAPLARGGSVMFIPDEDRVDPTRLQRFLERHQVTWGTIPPALLPLLEPDRLPWLRDLLTAGEPAGPEQVARWATGGRRFHNWYGPTETTVCVVGTELTGVWDRPLPIGYALPGCHAYILDDLLRPCPPGTPGELCIGGPQLARGYLDRPGLSAERFVPNPYGGPGARMYRTGDQVVLEDDGRIGFLGRLDRQVKVQGQRVEIGEVEAVLRAHPGVRQAVADVTAGPAGLKELTAYLAPEDAPGIDGVRAHCLESMPAYMVPTRVIRLAVLPLTVAGKIDMAALRAHRAASLANGAPSTSTDSGTRGTHPPQEAGPDRHATSETRPKRPAVREPGPDQLAASESGPEPLAANETRPERPAAREIGPARSGDEAAGEIERRVAAAWAEAFGTGEPGPDDDFLASGGHSLVAMRLTALLRTGLGREIEVGDVLAGRTVAGIARLAEQAPPVRDEPLAVAPAALSAVQRRMWFVERLAPGTPAHNIAMAQRLSGPLDVAALRAALAVVAERHEVLRWRVPQSDGVPAVAVSPPGPVPLPVEDVTEAEVGERLEAEARLAFDLATGPLWRARLLRVTDKKAGEGTDERGGERAEEGINERAGDGADGGVGGEADEGVGGRAGEEYVLAITAHHLVFDGWSQQVLYDDLGRAYRRAALTPLRTSFGGYVAYLDGRDKEANLEWWRDHLEGAPTVLDLPRDHPRPAVQTFEGAGATAEADASVSAGVRTLAARLGGTPYAVMLAAFAQVLRRLTGQRDLIVGAPVADRRDPAFHPLAGCLVQVLPVRLRVEDGETFEAHVTRSQEALSGALAHLDVHLERLVDRLGPGRDLSRNPLVQVLFNMYDFTEPRLELPGVTAVPLPPGLPGALFDLTLYVGERDGRYVLQAVYNPRLFRRERIEELLAGYLGILGDLVAVPERAVRRASLRSGPSGMTLPDGTGPLPGWDGPGVVERVLAQAAGLPPLRGVLTRTDGDQARDALGRADGVQAQDTPGQAGGDRVAVAGESGELTYAELVRLAVATGDAVSATVRPGETVAILAARTCELPALMLGVLGAGARWAVLDSALPPARLAAQARSADARALIACPGVPVPSELTWLPQPAGRSEPAEPAKTAGWREVAGLLGAAGTAGEVGFPVPFGGRGYLAFTSGTTGEPKPVRAAERPLARFLSWYATEYDLTADDRFALLAGLAHDPLLRDVWTPLTLGATLHVPGQDRVRDPARLASWLRQKGITVAHLTPQLATLIAAAGMELPDLRLVLFGGDRLTYAEVARFAAVAPKARLVNTYGTTETPQAQAVHEIIGQVTGSDPVPVGHGVDGAELLVLDAAGAPAAVGELGEVVIRSRRLAEAYLDEELTRQRFAREPDGETARYRTGDLGRHDPDGRVMIAGRADGQVKIRGYRVELGEVEAVLAAHPGVRAAAVRVAEQPAGRVLHAYAVPESAAVQAGELRRHLAAGLPDYAVPAELVLLPALPLTPNGKVDRAALPAPPPKAAAGHGQEPATATERLVAGIWREVLGLPRVSADANFFEIGGHSLATAQVQARLAASLGREVPIVDLFRFPTVRTLAAHLDGERRTAGTERAARRVAARRARPTIRPHRARRENEE
ncbi:amino acid adenylation domain-containing protein [Nonomuraea solani]|uniref:Amino acid adenylation domain-containing protein n=1 Tax=Nonomuraea solani TaxID=1144553 RepID=A0A1H6EYY6_9ACTN|nr:AMP-binding protein [Nonomuraea solani]SEH02583.1 amino acid adenylation domain-containing protein [Nonomuraea solani]